MQEVDIAIVGGGIIGLATAYHLTHRSPGVRVVVFEKEDELAQHQSRCNSGVIHSGIYYEPGSLKAENCRAGKQALEVFCEVEEIPFERCGKVIVATRDEERPILKELYERGQANGVTCSLIGPERLQELEPHARGVQAIHVPETGVVDYEQVALRFAQRAQEHGAEIRTGAEVKQLQTQDQGVVVSTPSEEVEAQFVINCAGLHADHVAELSGEDPGVQIVPFRGEYYKLTSEAESLCNGLIYPVPDPSFPFLGVHFTRKIDGSVECGPNAVLSFAREGYRKTEVDLSELAETLTYSGFLKMASRYWRTGLGEMWRSFNKKAFVRALQKLVPEVKGDHLTAAPAGVRAQAVTPDGELVDDFMIHEKGRVINVCNAPSPAATSSLSIASTLTEQLAERKGAVSSL